MLQNTAHQKVYLNDGSGNFTDGTTEVLPADCALNALGVIASDLNGDGLEDLYICDRNTGNNLKDVLLIRNFVEETKEKELSFDPIKLYPNPVNEYFFVELKFENLDSLSFKLMDNSGKNVILLNPEKYALQWYKVNIAPYKSKLLSETYFLYIQSGNKIYSGKIILE